MIPRLTGLTVFYDAKHVLSAYAVYEIPFGKRHRLGCQRERSCRCHCWRMVGQSIVSWHTGFPLALYDSAPILPYRFTRSSSGIVERDLGASLAEKRPLILVPQVHRLPVVRPDSLYGARHWNLR